MRLSPRLKARRGRFGASGLKGPTLVILGPGGILSFGPGSPTTIGNFTGTSSDDLDGDLSGSIIWHVQGSGSPSAGLPGGSPDSGVVEAGASANLAAEIVAVGSPQFDSSSFTVIGTVTDSGGARATRTLAVTVESYADYPPNLTFVSPASGLTFGPGSPLTIPNFVATSIDLEDGDISGSIEWTVQGPGSPGVTTFGSPTLATGASVDLSAFLLGLGSPQGVGSPFIASSFRVIARTTDSSGSNQPRTASITLNVVPAVSGSPLGSPKGP